MANTAAGLDQKMTPITIREKSMTETWFRKFNRIYVLHNY